jgi:hypothetical protein
MTTDSSYYNYCWTLLWRPQFVRHPVYAVILVQSVVPTNCPYGVRLSGLLNTTYIRASTSDITILPAQIKFLSSSLFWKFNSVFVLVKTNPLLVRYLHKYQAWTMTIVAAINDCRILSLSFFWEVTQRRLAVSYRRFWGCLTLENGVDRLSRNVGK